MKNQIKKYNVQLLKKNNNPKNPIIYFFTYLYRWFFFLIYKVYIIGFPQKQIILVDPTTKYIELNKTKLLESYKNTDINVNIEQVFYNKKELQQILLTQNNVLEQIWKTRILFENTPRGNIIMHYDVYKQGFSYYSDTNGIPYNILNAVAMKYVTVFHCRDLFMDNEYLEQDKESPLIKLYLEQDKDDKKETTEKSLPKLDDSAFAKLKNYKKTEINKDSNKDKQIPPEREYNRNIFIQLGKLSNFKFLQKTEKKSKLNGFYSTLLDGVSSESKLQHQVMNYSQFKELLMNNDL